MQDNIQHFQDFASFMKKEGFKEYGRPELKGAFEYGLPKQPSALWVSNGRFIVGTTENFSCVRATKTNEELYKALVKSVYSLCDAQSKDNGKLSSKTLGYVKKVYSSLSESDRQHAVCRFKKVLYSLQELWQVLSMFPTRDSGVFCRQNAAGFLGLYIENYYGVLTPVKEELEEKLVFDLEDIK